MTQLAAESVDPAGPVAETIRQLWWLMLGLGTAVFVLFVVLLARGLYRRRDGGDPARRADTGRWILGGGVLMPTAVLVVVFGATLYAMRAMPAEEPRDALVIEVIGHQWWYEVRYPEQNVTTRNELHLPVGRQVVLKLSSADVIHSFWVPELGGKLDMLPDKTNTMVLQADKPGRYHSQCAEFCGLHHADMRLRVVAESPDRFAAWLAAER